MSFLRLTTIEMRRAMQRRLVRMMILLAVLLCLIPAIAAFVSSSDPVKFVASDEHPARMADWWIPGTADGFLIVAALFIMIGAAICAASVAGAEWRAGTIATVLTWEPSRWRLHGARTLSAFVLAFLISFALQAVFLASAVPAVIAHGSTAGTGAGWWSSLLLAMLRISLIAALVAVLALSISTIGRNTSAGLITMAAWAIAIERLVVGLRPQWARFMITENVATVVPWVQISDVEFTRPPVIALLALVVYLGLIVLAASWSFARRDVATA